MTLEQLRIFVAVAETQHVTKAAKSLNLAQSAASAAIAALEARHGARLFNRVGRNIELTDAGRIFLTEAKAVLARVAAAELTLAELGGLKRGNLLIQASQTVASYWLPRHLVVFKERFPGVEIDLRVGNSEQVAEAVRAGLAEIGFVEGDIDDGSLSVAPIARDQLMLVVAPDHPWANLRRFDPRRLGESNWILRERGSGTRATFEAALPRFGLSPADLNVTLELPSNEAVRAAVEASSAATVLSASVVVAGLEAGLLKRVPLELPERAFHMVRHRERHQSAATEALLQIIRGKAPGRKA
ncbi:MAG TPA: LysR substrate-binding domain-containing protein [Dongiaceae bacterium]|nr:LysR substrate-binding domain-containing protein [Dongiaceae bacterium]